MVCPYIRRRARKYISAVPHGTRMAARTNTENTLGLVVGTVQRRREKVDVMFVENWGRKERSDGSFYQTLMFQSLLRSEGLLLPTLDDVLGSIQLYVEDVKMTCSLFVDTLVHCGFILECPLNYYHKRTSP